MPNKKINFKTPLLDLGGEKTDVMLNEVLAKHMMGTPVKENPTVKLFSWARDLKKNGELAIDKEDEDTLCKWLKTCSTLNVNVSGTSLEIIDEVK